MSRGDLLGAALVGGGLALLGAAIGGAFRAEPAPAPPPAAPPSYGLAQMFAPVPTPSRFRTRFECAPPFDVRSDARAERDRQVRVYAYRIRIGEITLASPDVPADLSADIADLLEGRCAPPPCAAAEGALPLDWQ